MNAVARLVVPELGIDGVPLSVSLWLVQEGDAVQEGDRVVELLAGGITIDLVAPASGRLARQLIEEDEQVSAGTVLAEFDRA